jgi:hypothetical protein
VGGGRVGIAQEPTGSMCDVKRKEVINVAGQGLESRPVVGGSIENYCIGSSALRSNSISVLSVVFIRYD